MRKKSTKVKIWSKFTFFCSMIQSSFKIFGTEWLTLSFCQIIILKSGLSWSDHIEVNRIWLLPDFIQGCNMACCNVILLDGLGANSRKTRSRQPGNQEGVRWNHQVYEWHHVIIVPCAQGTTCLEYHKASIKQLKRMCSVVQQAFSSHFLEVPCSDKGYWWRQLFFFLDSVTEFAWNINSF